ncbi:MAG: transglycosylase SLT domain-containing protein [Flavimaricola sp.]|nr:transglycosylase SLT domain-containing protein [Flavimaricola sp.]
MRASQTILGGILAVIVGMGAPLSAQVRVANPQSEPLKAGTTLSGEDVFGALPELAGFRPEPRPAHMLRYPVEVQTGATVRPVSRRIFRPAARWDSQPDGALWTQAAMTALATNAPGIVDIVPRDIATWCPGYATNPPQMRRAFWVGMMSALAWHESRHRPDAVGGGNQWFGLMQIYPPTARGYSCRARTGAALTDPEDNLSCAARIMNVTVSRDRAVAVNDGRWRGIAADWGPMTSRAKRQEMAEWTRRQSYCQVQTALALAPRPPARPMRLSGQRETISTSNYVRPVPHRPHSRPE